MNDVSLLEASRFVGQRMMKEGGAAPEARLRYGFRLVTGRAPSAVEQQILHDSLQYHLDYFSDKKNDVAVFPQHRGGPAQPGPDSRDPVACTTSGSAPFNFHDAGIYE